MRSALTRSTVAGTAVSRGRVFGLARPAAARDSLQRVDRGGQREVALRQAARGVRRQRDPQPAVAVDQDVRMVIRGLGLGSDAIDQRDRRREVRALQIGDDRVALAPPGRAQLGERRFDL